MEIQLLVRSNAEESVRHHVLAKTGTLVLGRAPESAVPLEGAAISREHVVLELEDGAVFATDLSNNGTWVNGRRVSRNRRFRLENGDTIEIPGYQISLQVLESDSGNQLRKGANPEEGQSTTLPRSLEVGDVVRRFVWEPLTTFLNSFSRLEQAVIIQALGPLILLLAFFVF